MPRRLAFALCAAIAIGCTDSQPPFKVLPPGALHTHYLIDLEHTQDSTTGFATSSHLVVLNPGARDANLSVTAYYEASEPDTFALTAIARTSSESNSLQWPIRRGVPFALRVESDQPVICQATIGWSNTLGDYGARATTHSRDGVRETAKSYNAIQSLARYWYYADAIVINGRPNPPMWVSESEWAIILNPGDQAATVKLGLYYNGQAEDHNETIAPRRVRRIFMDSVAKNNAHYGASFASDRPVAVQWLRTVNWYDRPDLMAFWSVPAVPLDRPFR